MIKQIRLSAIVRPVQKKTESELCHPEHLPTALNALSYHSAQQSNHE